MTWAVSAAYIKIVTWLYIHSLFSARAVKHVMAHHSLNCVRMS